MAGIFQQYQGLRYASGPARSRVRTALNYFDKRRAQLAYARFQAAGYPSGSGSVESGNQAVVEARLKGAGMSLDGRDVPHEARERVNPRVALRDVLCSARWEQDWPPIATRLREEHLKQRQQRQHTCWLQRHTRSTRSAPPTSSPAPVKITAMTHEALRTQKAKQPYRPPANHPWQPSPIGRARFKPHRSGHDPKP